MIDGIPWHPLVTHAPIILIPLSAILLLLAVLIRPIRKQVAVVGVVLAILAAVSAFLARSTGYELSQDIGVPEAHSRWALPLVISSSVFAGAALVWWISQLRARPDRVSGKVVDSALTRVVGLITVLAGVTATVFVVLAGHSGASAVWAEDDAQRPNAEATPTPGSSAGDEPTAPADPTSTANSGTAGPEETFSFSEVEANDSADSCWSVINGDVYDLTEWIGQHPGGSGAIESLCGIDATETFNAQHGGSSGPEEQLEQLRIGVLAE